MKNQKVSTKLGTIALVIIAITVGIFVWLIEKKQEATEQLQPVIENQVQQNKEQQQVNGNNKSDCLLNNSSEKTEWKTFKNDQYKFEIQYPSNFIYNEHLANTPGEIIQPRVNYIINLGTPNKISSENNLGCIASNNFIMYISNNENGLDDYIKNAKLTNGAVENSFEPLGTSRVGNLTAKIVKTCDMGGNCNKDIFFTDKKYIYFIRLSQYFTLKNVSAKQTIDHMLASFKFIN